MTHAKLHSQLVAEKRFKSRFLDPGSCAMFIKPALWIVVLVLISYCI